MRRPGIVREHLDGLLRVLLVLLVAEQVLLDPVGEPGDPDPEQAYAAGGVELAEQARASRAIVGAASVGAGSVVERDRVVKSCSRTLIVIVRPGQPVLAQPLGDLRGLRVTRPAIRRGR